ncbi:MAG: hypothetical protein JOZ54_07085, partial [Acidobacteria bacterium]|nr:hypothetical protein [Acidobacteriota bacterium]
MRNVLAVLLLALAAAASAAPPAQPSPAAAPQQVTAEQILVFLNRTVGWYQRIDGQTDLVDQPTDILFLNDNRQLARQVVTLSFEAAKAEAQWIAAQAVVTANPQDPRQQRLAKRASSAADLLRREQARLAELQRQLAAATPADRPRLEAAVAEAQSRVGMATVRNEAFTGIVGFVNETGGNGGGSDLASQINALEQTVTTTPAPTPVPAAAKKAPPSSVVGLIADLIHLNQKDNNLITAMRAADILQRDARALMAPITGQLQQSRQRTDALLNAPESSDPAELMRRKTELDALSARFRSLTAAMLPLAKRRILLDAYKANVGRWRESVADQSHDDFRRLTFRGVFLGILLLIVIAIAVAWRRITFRYVADSKRRHHFLLIRRIVLLILTAGILTAT